MINDNLTENYEDLDIQKLINIFLRKKFFIFFIVLISSISTSIFVLKAKTIYQGTFNIVIKGEKSSRGIEDNVLSSLLDVNTDDNETQKLILSSSSVLLPVYEFVQKYNINKGLETKSPSFSKWAKTSLKIGFERKSSVLKVAYKSSDKDLILETLNKISSKYKDYSKRDKEKSINKTIKYLKSQTKLMREKALSSQKEFNLFSIENGLGNIDGFIGLGKTSDPLINKNINLNSIIIKDLERPKFSEKKSNAGQRFTTQFSLLEKYESQYIDLSSKLKPNSKTLNSLKVKIDNLRSSLKRPNQILTQYKTLKSKAQRDEQILLELENKLQLINLEKIKTPTAWEMISTPTIADEIVFPQKKKLVFLAFTLSFLISCLVSILFEAISGNIYEFKDFRKKIPYKFLGTLYKNDFDLNSKIIKNIINKNNKSNYKLGLIFLSNNFYNSNLPNKFKLKKEIINYEEIDSKQIDSISDFEDIILVADPGEININDLQILNNYISLINKKITGWIFLDFKKD